MAINCLCNKRCGPGGGTRRLHHMRGRNRIDVRSKDTHFARHGTVVIGLKPIRGNLNTASSNSGRKTARNRNNRVPANCTRRREDRKAA